MRNPVAAALLGCTLLAACATSQATLTADVTKAETVFADTVIAYDAAKLVAAGLAITNPSLGVTLAKVEGIVDPLVAQAQAIEAAAVVDAPALLAIVGQIEEQVAAIERPSAEAVRVAAVRR